MKRIIACSAVLAVALALQSCGFGGFKATTTKSQTITHMDMAALEVETRNGSVEVIGDSSLSDVKITATITAGGSTQQEADDRLAATTLSVVRGADRTLTIKPIYPDKTKRNGDGASFVIHLPNASGVTIDTSNGAVTALNLSGELRVDTSNASIVVTDHNGSAHVETSNGRVTATNLAGSLWVDTSNGRVIASNIAGPATIDTSNGSITLSLADDQSGPIEVDTSNGNIVITVGDAFAGQIGFDTSNGRITVNDPANVITRESLRRRGGTIEIGEGERSIIDTSNGNITFTIGG